MTHNFLTHMPFFYRSDWIQPIYTISNQAAMHERAHAKILEWGLKRSAVNSIHTLPSSESF